MLEPSQRHDSDSLGRHRLLKNVASGWGAHLIVVIIGFVMPRLVDESVGQRMLGLWDLGWSTASYLGLGNIGIAAALTHYVSRYTAAGEKELLKHSIASAFVWQVVMAIVIFTGVLFLPSLLSDQIPDLTAEENEAFYWVVILLGAGIAVNLVDGVYRGVLTGAHRWDLNNAVSITNDLAIATAMIAALFMGYGIVGLAVANLMCVILSLIGRAIVCRIKLPDLRVVPGRASWEHTRNMLMYGAKTTLGVFFNVFTMQGARLLVAMTSGPAALAMFARPLTLTQQSHRAMDRFSVVFTSVAASAIGSNRKSELANILLGASRVTLMIGLPILVILAVYEQLILALWMGDNYVTQGVLPILCAGALIQLWQGPSSRILAGMNAHGRPAITAFVVAVSLFLLITALLDFSLQAHDAALVVSCCLAGSGSIYIGFSCKRVGVSPLTLVWESIGKVALCVAPSGFLLLEMSKWSISGNQLGDAVVCTSVFALTMLPSYFFLIDQKVGAIFGSKIPARKALLYQLFYYCGVIRLMEWFRRNQLTIVTTHSVMNLDHAGKKSWFPLRTTIDPKDLDKQLGWLSEKYTFIDADSAMQFLRGEKQIKRPMLFTIDDGYENAIDVALPVLQRYEIPCLVFLVSGACKNGEPFWFDRLDYVLQQLGAGSSVYEYEGETFDLDLSSRPAARSTCLKLIRESRGKFASDKERAQWMIGLVELLESHASSKLKDLQEDNWSSLISFERAQKVTKSVTFGGHTVDHIRLAGLDEETIQYQLTRCKDDIEKELQSECSYFCYPEGSYDENVCRLTKDAEYVAAFTSEPGANSVGCDLFRLKRYHLKNDQLKGQLFAEIGGFRELLLKVYKRDD